MFAGMPTLETVYIETSVVSYLVAQPSRNPITTLRQQLTKEWWTNQREKFVRVISQEVMRFIWRMPHVCRWIIY